MCTRRGSLFPLDLSSVIIVWSDKLPDVQCQLGGPRHHRLWALVLVSALGSFVGCVRQVVISCVPSRMAYFQPNSSEFWMYAGHWFGDSDWQLLHWQDDPVVFFDFYSPSRNLSVVVAGPFAFPADLCVCTHLMCVRLFPFPVHPRHSFGGGCARGSQLVGGIPSAGAHLDGVSLRLHLARFLHGCPRPGTPEPSLLLPSCCLLLIRALMASGRRWRLWSQFLCPRASNSPTSLLLMITSSRWPPLLCGRPPIRTLALTFSTPQIKSQRQIMLTGHSLGGSVAQVVGAKESIPAITYSAPGIVYSRR